MNTNQALRKMVPSLTLRFRMPALPGLRSARGKNVAAFISEIYSIDHRHSIWIPRKIKQHNSWRTDGFWVAHASRVWFRRLAETIFLEKSAKVGHFRQHARRVRYPIGDYSVRSASTGLSRLARRAGNKHASNAAIPRTAIVAINRSGLCADVSIQAATQSSGRAQVPRLLQSTNPKTTGLIP